MHNDQNLFYPERAYGHVTWVVVGTITSVPGAAVCVSSGGSSLEMQDKKTLQCCHNMA